MRGVSMKTKRTWWERFVILTSCLVIMALVMGGVAVRFISEEIKSFNRISGAGILAKNETIADPFNVLVIGVDNAEGLDEGDSVLTGRNTSSLLTDTMMLVRVDPQNRVVAITSIPRDLWVSVGSTNYKEKINAALSLGGPAALLETIQRELGIPVNHYVQVNFKGFSNFVERLQGVPMSFATPVRDTKTGFSVEQPGCWYLDGRQALALVRSRSYEALVDGNWVTDPTGDIGRTVRQQRFVEAALDRAITKGARNPFELRGIVNSVKDELVLDDQLSIEDMLKTASRFQDFRLGQLIKMQLPVTFGWEGAASVVYLTPEATPVLDVFRGSAPIPIPIPTTSSATGITDPFSDIQPALPTPDQAIPDLDELLFVPAVPAADASCGR